MKAFWKLTDYMTMKAYCLYHGPRKSSICTKGELQNLQSKEVPGLCALEMSVMAILSEKGQLWVVVGLIISVQVYVVPSTLLLWVLGPLLSPVSWGR